MDFDDAFDYGDAGASDGTVLIGGYDVPMDPMDLLRCDSCQ